MNESNWNDLDNESGHEVAESVAENIEQQPNSVVHNGGPVLLRGFMLPLPPSANRYWKNVVLPTKGMKYPVVLPSLRALYQRFRMMSVQSAEAKEYLETVKEVIIQRNARFFTDKQLRMDLVVCPRDRRSIDVHNYLKVLADVLQEAGVYQDDEQIVDVRIRLGGIIKGGRVVVSLTEIKHDADATLREAWR